MEGGLTINLDTSALIPEYVKKLPFSVRVGWLKVYNLGLDQYGEYKALKMANLWALKELDRIEMTPEEAKDNDYSDELIERVIEKDKTEFVSTKLEESENGMVTFSNDGEIIIEAVLADNTFSTDGKRFSDEALISMAEQINQKGLALPDIEHLEYNELLETSVDAQEFKEKLKDKKGLLTKVKAFYNEGKLLIKAWLDKRYKKHVGLYKNLSIEAYSPKNRQQGDVYLWAEPLSFTFTNDPKLKGAELLNVCA